MDSRLRVFTRHIKENMKLERVGKTGLRITGIEQPIVVIGDVHGHYWTLIKLLKQIPEDCLIVFCGDLIDRGPYSRQVVDLVKGRYFCTKGNHEDMMVEEASVHQQKGMFNWWGLWLQGYVGGWDTLESYQYHDKDENDKPLFKKDRFFDHALWMRDLPIYIEFPEIKNDIKKHLVVSHSSAHNCWHTRHHPAHEWTFERSTIWSHLAKDSRCEYGLRNPKKIENVFNVFGHTPIPNGPKVGRHFAAIDAGTYANKRHGLGKLIGFQFPEGIIYEQEKVETGCIDEQLKTHQL